MFSHHRYKTSSELTSSVSSFTRIHISNDSTDLGLRSNICMGICEIGEIFIAFTQKYVTEFAG